MTITEYGGWRTRETDEEETEFEEGSPAECESVIQDREGFAACREKRGHELRHGDTTRTPPHMRQRGPAESMKHSESISSCSGEEYGTLIQDPRLRYRKRYSAYQQEGFNLVGHLNVRQKEGGKVGVRYQCEDDDHYQKT